MVHLYSSIDTAIVWKKSRFILSDKSYFYMIDNLWIVVHAFAWRVSTSLSVDKIVQPRYVNLSTNFRGSPLREEVAPCRLKLVYSVVFAFTLSPLPFAACSRLSHILLSRCNVSDPKTTNFAWVPYYFCLAEAASAYGGVAFSQRSVWRVASSGCWVESRFFEE